MVVNKDSGAGKGAYKITGGLELETRCDLPNDISLTAYAFDHMKNLLCSTELDKKGCFNLSFSANDAPEIDLRISASGDEKAAISSALYSAHYNRNDWIDRLVRVEAFIPKLVWWPWWPKQICVSGHVRKVPFCPVPFTKVEIFDVDRELCFWPFVTKFKDLIKKHRVLALEDIQEKFPDLPELIREAPGIELPIGPDPSPEFNQSLTNFDEVAFNPQPEPPAEFRATGLNKNINQTANFLTADLRKATVTSKLAPWILFPNCFYSKQLLCTTNTDENGYFNCCFKWWPLHIKHGHLRFDARPDIIIRVTQVIDGVPKVIYMDPYANTRWNVNNVHIDLFLNDPEIECGDSGDNRPEGTDTFFTRIGNDEVYKIDQNNGTYNATSSTSNMAYGSELRVFAVFGDTLSRVKNIPGAKKPYFYKVSYDGIPITTALKDTRVNKTTLQSESHTLGPVTRGAESALFEIRDFDDYYWYNPDWIARWITATSSNSVITKLVPDGLRVLKLEIFDDDGKLLDDSKINYLDGTKIPPVILPAHYPCTMKVTIDNNPPVVSMNVLPAPTGCGVIKHTDVPPLNVNVSVSQVNNRVKQWRLSYVKGTNPASITLSSQSSASGNASVGNLAVPANSMIAGLTTTCAFAIKLYADAHIRNGYGQIYDKEQLQAIAIEKCEE